MLERPLEEFVFLLVKILFLLWNCGSLRFLGFVYFCHSLLIALDSLGTGIRVIGELCGGSEILLV